MTNPTPHGQEPEALRLADTLDLAPENGIEPQTSEDAAAELRRLHAENEALQAGYAAARLEIESLEARIKTMAEEHADELMVAHMDGMRAEQAIPGVQWQCGPQANGFTAQAADSVPAVSDLPPLPAPDLRDVGTKPQEIKEFLKGYATEYARTAIAARAPADSEDAAQVEIDLFNDLNRIYGNTLTAYAKELCRLGYRKTNAARKQGANHD